MTELELIEKFNNQTEFQLNVIIELIKSEIRAKGITNTGSAENSMEVKQNVLYGASYIYYLVHGRKNGKFPPLNAIREWVRSKLGVEESEVNSIAFLVGRKIAEQGTDIYKNPSKGIELDKLLINFDFALSDGTAEVAKAEALTFVNDLYK